MHTQLIIDNLGREAQGGRTFQRRNPLTGELVSEGAAASVEDALDAVESASKAFASWATSGPSTRRAVMLKAADIMERRTPEFIEAMMSEVGAASSRPLQRLPHRAAFPRGRWSCYADPGRDDPD